MSSTTANDVLDSTLHLRVGRPKEPNRTPSPMSDDSSDFSEETFSIPPVVSERVPGDKSAWSQQTNMERLLWLVKLPFRVLLCLSHVTVFFIAYVGFMLPMLWARPVWPRLYWFYEGKLYRWLQASIGYWGYTIGYGVIEYGDDVARYCPSERVLLMCNHQSTADVPTLFAILQNKGVASRKTVWLMDVMFRWTPFGMIGRMHGDYFIQQGKSTRDRELQRLRDHMQHVFWNRDRRWVILFPEGGFYWKRIATSQKYGREHGYPHLENITLPRLGAVKEILSVVGPREDDGELIKSRSDSKLKFLKDTVAAIREKKYLKETRPPIKYILDVTIAYPYAKPLDLQTLCFGTREPCDVGVNYRIFNASEVPFRDEEKLRDWMYTLYKEKDDMLETYYTKGVFVEGEVGTRVYFSWWKIVGQQIFWFASLFALYRVYSFLFLSFLRVLGIIA